MRSCRIARIGSPRLVTVVVAMVAGFLMAVAVTATASASTILPPPLPPYAAPSLINYNLLYGGGAPGLSVDGAVPSYYEGGLVNVLGVDALEQQAIANVITDHGLPSETNEGGPESELVSTWGRNDAEAELWALLVQAIQTPAAQQTPDQAEAVAWFSQAVTGYNTTLALQAAYEYAAWAGLGDGNLEDLLDDGDGTLPAWTTSSLEQFLSQPPAAYGSGYSESSPQESWNEGYCAYDPPGSPSYTSSIYGGTSTSPLCYGGCPSIAGCPVTAPSLQDFIDWGEEDVQNEGIPGLSQTPGSVAVSSNIAEAIGFGATAIGTSAAGLALTPSLTAALATPEFAAATAPFTFLSAEGALAAGQLEIAAGAASTAAFSIASATAIVLTAVAAIVIDGIQTFSESVPDQLADYIAGQEAAPDLDSMLSTSSGMQELYTVFTNATGPAPTQSSCDDTNLAVPTAYTLPTPCLNAPAIPAATASDPQFTITENGATTSTTSSTISWADATTGTTNTARIADQDWWVQTQTTPSGATTTAQTLEINYTDWQGNARVAWLQVNPDTGAYTFLTDTMSATSGVDTTCAASGACTDSSSIEYVGTDGNDYTASIPGTGQAIPAPPALTTYPVGIDLSGPLAVVTGHPATLTAELTAGVNDLPFSLSNDDYGTMTFAETVDGVTTTLCSDVPEALTSEPSEPSELFQLAVPEATCSATFNSTDSATITATYNPVEGDGDYQPAQATLDVTPTDLAPTTTTVTASSTTPEVGSGVTYTATVADQVTGVEPDGTVSFAGAGAGASCQSVMVSDGAATCEADVPAVGSQTMTATYNGDSSTAASSGSVTVVADEDLPLTIEGSQVYGSTPTFWIKDTTLPADVTVTGAPTCSFLTSGSLITEFLTPGSYTLEGDSSVCKGVTLSNPYYFVVYNGGTFTVNPASASITLASGPTNPVVGGTYTVGGTASSGAPVSFAIDSTTANACSLSGSTVTFEHAGRCLIDATAPATTDYQAPAQVQEQITVDQAPQTFSVQAPASGQVDGSATLSATLGPAGNSANFNVDESSESTCRVSGATVTFLAVGSCVVTANEPGDDDYLQGDASATIAVDQAPSSITLSSLPATPVAGGSFQAKAVISPQGPGAVPTGQVTFSVDGTQVGSPVDTGGGAATSPVISGLGAGTHTVTASYGGDGNFLGSSTTLQVTVAPASPTVAVTAAPSSGATVATPVTVTATVAGVAGGDVPTGTVTFDGDAATCGTVNVVSGVASCPLGDLAVGSYSFTATYNGDSDYQAQSGSLSSYDVVVTATTTTVTPSVATPVYGQPVSFTAAVTAGGAPVTGGTVQWKVDGTDLGSPVTVDATGSATSPTVSDLTVGFHAVTALYLGTATTDGPSTGSLPVTVAPAATRTTVAVTASQLTATVTAIAPGAGTPAGTVTFSVSGHTVGSASLSASGVATLAETSQGAQTVAAVYAGDSSYMPSSGSTATRNPTITARVRSAHPKTRYGWYRSPVTVSFTCRAGSAPLTASCPRPVTLGRSAADQSVTRTVHATDGGLATVSATGIDIDRVPPRVRVSGVRSGELYDAPGPTPRCAASDALSGVVGRCAFTVRRHLSWVAYTVTATDRAGNTATVRGRYRLLDDYLVGVPRVDGRFVVTAGHDYTVEAYAPGEGRPRYLYASPAGDRPSPGNQAMQSIGATGSWVILVNISQAMTSHRYWVLWVRAGGTTHAIPITLRS